MGRKPASVRTVKRVIKVTLHPVRHQHLINMIDAAPNKSRLVVNALEGRLSQSKPEPAEADDELHTQLEDFLM